MGEFIHNYKLYLRIKSRDVSKAMIESLYEITKYILGDITGKQFFIILLKKYYDLKNNIIVDQFLSEPIKKIRINIYDALCIFQTVGLISEEIDLLQLHDYHDAIYQFDIKFRFILLFYLKFGFIKEESIACDEFVAPLNQAIYEILLDGKCPNCKRIWIENICSTETCNFNFIVPNYIKTKAEYLAK